MSIYYEIRIAGLVPPDAMSGFEEFAAEHPAETMVCGPLPDQAALHGLLARFEASGVQLTRLRRHKQRSPSSRGSSRSARTSHPRMDE